MKLNLLLYLSQRILSSLLKHPIPSLILRVLSSSAAKLTLLLLLLSRRVSQNSRAKAVLSVVMGVFMIGYAIGKWH